MLIVANAMMAGVSNRSGLQRLSNALLHVGIVADGLKGFELILQGRLVPEKMAIFVGLGSTLGL